MSKQAARARFDQPGVWRIAGTSARPSASTSALWVIGLLLAWIFSGCASPQGTVVLLPNPEGRTTAVVVAQDAKQLVLDQPFAAARLTSAGPRAYAASGPEVQAQFGAALAAQPQPPTSFTLYFVEGKDEFTEQSAKMIDGVFSEIANRPVPDVVVIGHTDTVGSDAVNDPLSRQRAEVVRTALLARGVAPERVVAFGRGKRDLIVHTADGVAEPRNRRVQILVR